MGVILSKIVKSGIKLNDQGRKLDQAKKTAENTEEDKKKKRNRTQQLRGGKTILADRTGNGNKTLLGG